MRKLLLLPLLLLLETCDDCLLAASDTVLLLQAAIARCRMGASDSKNTFGLDHMVSPVITFA